MPHVKKKPLTGKKFGFKKKTRSRMNNEWTYTTPLRHRRIIPLAVLEMSSARFVKNINDYRKYNTLLTSYFKNQIWK